jgi:WD40 repeat protein
MLRLFAAWMALSACPTLAAGAADALPPPSSDRPQPGTDLYGDPLPPGAVARLGTIRFRRQDSIQNVGFLPDGRTLVFITPKDGLRHYDARTGKLLRCVPLGKHRVSASAWTRDRKRLALLGTYFDEKAAAYSYQIQVIDPGTGKGPFRVELTDRLGEKLAISPDGATVVVVDRQGKLRFWDVASGTEILAYQMKQRGGIECLEFSPDSSLLAVGSRDGIYLWDWTSARDPRKVLLGQPPRSRRQPLSLAFSPDGKILAIGLAGRGGVAMLDVSTASLTGELNRNEQHGWSYVRDVAFSPDGTRLAATRYRTGGRGVVIWDAVKRRPLQTLDAPLEDCSNVAFSPDGSMLAGISIWRNTHAVWDLKTGAVVPGDVACHTIGPSSIRFLGDGKTIATAGDDATVRIWETRTGRQLALFAHQADRRHGGSPWVRAMAASPDGKWLASSSLDDTVRLWDASSGKEVYRLPGHGRLGGYRALAFTADGRRFASWGDDMRVCLWDVQTGKALEEYRLEPSGIAMPPEDSVSSIGDPENPLNALGTSRFSPDASWFVLNLGAIYVFEVSTGKELYKFKIEQGRPADLAVSPDKRYVLTSQWGPPKQTKLADGRMRYSSAENQFVALRRLEDGRAVRKIALSGRAGPVAFSPDGKFFAIAARGDTPQIRVFLADSGEEAARIPHLDSAAESLAFSRDNKRLATGLRNGTALVWDLAAVIAAAAPPSK